MIRRKGSCLCGKCTFEVEGEIKGITQCHCSLCRKLTGTAGISIFPAPTGGVTWLTGGGAQVTHVHSPIYAATRCKTCGSPLTYTYEGDGIWVSAGAMDDPLDVGIDTHYFCASKGDWDFDTQTARSYDEIPH